MRKWLFRAEALFIGGIIALGYAQMVWGWF